MAKLVPSPAEVISIFDKNYEDMMQKWKLSLREL